MPEPLYGFDTFPAVSAVTSPYVVGSTLLSVTLPPRTVVAGLDLSASVLDINAAPTIELDIGDVADVDRFVAGASAAATGALLEYRPTNGTWYRYNQATAVNVRVAVGAATATASGSLSIVVYGYPGADVSEVNRTTLQVLGVLAEGETPRAEDAAIAQAALEEVHEVLRGKGIANRQDMAWPLAAVPMFALRPYATMAANLLADTFGVSAQRAQRLAARAVEGEREIRRQTAKRSLGGPVSLEPYRDPPPHILDFGVLG